MRIFQTETRIDFMGQRRLVAMMLALLIAVSLGSLLFRGLVLGLDFTGGTLIELGYPEPIDVGLCVRAWPKADLLTLECSTSVHHRI